MLHLFSYGTIQQEDVQVSTSGRTLAGVADKLPGFRQSLVKIEDPGVVATSGKTRHPIVKFTGAKENRVGDTVFEIAAAELACADWYELSAYERINVTLASGTRLGVRRGKVRADGFVSTTEPVLIVGGTLLSL